MTKTRNQTSLYSEGFMGSSFLLVVLVGILDDKMYKHSSILELTIKASATLQKQR